MKRRWIKLEDVIWRELGGIAGIDKATGEMSPEDKKVLEKLLQDEFGSK